MVFLLVEFCWKGVVKLAVKVAINGFGRIGRGSVYIVRRELRPAAPHRVYRHVPAGLVNQHTDGIRAVIQRDDQASLGVALFDGNELPDAYQFAARIGSSRRVDFSHIAGRLLPARFRIDTLPHGQVHCP